MSIGYIGGFPILPTSYATQTSPEVISVEPGDVVILSSKQKPGTVKAKCSSSNQTLKSTNSDKPINASQFAKNLGQLGFYNGSLVRQAA